MADRSAIEWTDATWNPLRGCSRVSAGCQHCYAERVAARFSGPGMPYEGLIHPTTRGWNGQVRLVPEVLDQPLRWRRPRRIFVNSMSDLFHESVPDEWIDQVFAVMALAHRHTFQILTKRPWRMRDYLQRRTDEIRKDLFNSAMAKAIYAASRAAGHALPGNAVLLLLSNDDNWRAHPESVQRTPGWPLRHVWLGVSVENQAAADDRIPLLLEAPVAVRWLSCEPMVGPVNLKASLAANHLHEIDGGPRIDWVVVGGESGAGARPMHPDWARSLRDQCAAAGVPFFFKQWGEYSLEYDRDRDDSDYRRCGDMSRLPGRWVNLAGGHGFHGDRVHYAHKVGKKRAGRLLDGREHNEYPLEDMPA